MLGQRAVYAVSHYPLDDAAFANNHYPQEDGEGLRNVDRMVHLSTGSPTGAFVYTPTVAGDHTLSVDQSGEYMMPPPPLHVMVQASCDAKTRPAS